jgi:hypothetical protein
MKCVASNVPVDGGTLHLCAWQGAPDGGFAVQLNDMALPNFNQFQWDMATVDMALPVPIVAGRSALGALSTDGTNIVWEAGAAGGPTWLLERLSPTDTVPQTVATLSDLALASTINGSTVYMSTAGTSSSTGTISSVPLSGGSAHVIVANQPINNNVSNQSEWFIQTDGTTLFWTTPSDTQTQMATGTIASAPIAGPTATVLVSNVAVPTGLLRANSLTYYTSAGTAPKNFGDAVLSTVGGQPLDKQSPLFDVHSDGAGGILYIKAGSVLRLAKNATAPQTIHMATDFPMCQAAYCASALTSAPGGKVYWVGQKQPFGRATVFESDTPIVDASTANVTSQPITTIVYANQTLYWIELNGSTGNPLWSYKP